uniref:Uncharacterized protein n=1 Tax=Gopherus evgoodei TaxID=1825980 RepID=A0A8C4YEU9_9SAUR
MGAGFCPAFLSSRSLGCWLSPSQLSCSLEACLKGAVPVRGACRGKLVLQAAGAWEELGLWRAECIAELAHGPLLLGRGEGRGVAPFLGRSTGQQWETRISLAEHLATDCRVIGG